MTHSIIHLLKDLINQALQKLDYPLVDIQLSRPKNSDHGDYSSNIALQLAKSLKSNPRQIAEQICSSLSTSTIIDKVEIAGAGFINFTLSISCKVAVIEQVLQHGKDYARIASNNKSLLLEYVSANPTGPLHVGHGRGAAYGSSLAKLMRFAGWQVDEEYYVNDAGRQMDILGLSTWLRYLQNDQCQFSFPPNAYQGEYVRDMAQQLHALYGEQFLIKTLNLPELPTLFDKNDAEIKNIQEQHLDLLINYAKDQLKENWPIIRSFALNQQLDDCRDDLSQFGVTFARWYSELSLFTNEKVSEVITKLDQAGFLYAKDGAIWFRSSDFGDEKDRVVQRENGQFTYFASDIAYHLEKFQRGYSLMIDIWGADHHGYIPRVKGALSALGLDTDKFLVNLVQFAVLYRSGEKVSMSTRAGEFVTLRTLRQEVGNDACRFFYVMRKSDQHLDFDLDLATSKSQENPVYYIQYAYARCCSLIREWGGDLQQTSGADLLLLNHQRELTLLSKISDFPETLQIAAREFAPHQIAYFLKELVQLFHSWYNDVRILQQSDELTLARISLVVAMRQVIENALGILGVSCPESM